MNPPEYRPGPSAPIHTNPAGAGGLIAQVVGEFPACLGHRHTRPAGGGADVGNGCEQRVLPEIVGLPPDNFLKQVGFGPAMQGCRGLHGLLELLVLPAAECALRQEAVPDPFQGQRVVAAGAAPAERVGGQVQENLTGEGVVARMQRREFVGKVKEVGVVGQAVEQDPPGGDGVLGCRPVPGRHTEKIGQNWHGSADPLALEGRPPFANPASGG